MHLNTIKKVFIVNRGEICRRLAVTARQLGATIATLWKEGEPPPRFLAEVIDEFVPVKELTTATYLNHELMIQLAKQCGADAIHPGYGFLSENAEFARSVANAGLIWIGPHPEAIEKMASKAHARRIAVEVEAPCIEAIEDINHKDLAEALPRVKAFGQTVGYPLLVKAALGGGGKGMRLVHDESELENALSRASSEGESAFGSGQIIVEKYVIEPRHVEVQVLADKHGQVFAIGDRDCSVQRRHQKIIEEAPAPGLSEATRKAMQVAACKLAKAVGYDSAGTVEFLVDWGPEHRQAEKQPFYFLEMNTRLQVEHPVTEEAFGLDLAAWQLKAADGQKLPAASLQDRQPIRHAIEVRLYAEDCQNNFMPAPGPVVLFEPPHLPGVRWEVGLDRVDEISMNFDPMMAKVVASAETRPQAIRLLLTAIDKTVLMAEKHNMNFVAAILRDSSFKTEPVSTRFIEQQLPFIQEKLAAFETSRRQHCHELLARLTNHRLNAGRSFDSGTNIKDLTASAFQNLGSSTTTPEAMECDIIVHCEQKVIMTRHSRRQIRMGTGLWPTAGGGFAIFHYAEIKETDTTDYWVWYDGLATKRQEKRISLSNVEASKDQSSLQAPVPGKVVCVNVEAGASVKENQVLVVLESMKMEFEVKSTSEGTVEKVLVQVGEQVDAGSELIQWAEND